MGIVDAGIDKACQHATAFQVQDGLILHLADSGSLYRLGIQGHEQLGDRIVREGFREDVPVGAAPEIEHGILGIEQQPVGILQA